MLGRRTLGAVRPARKREQLNRALHEARRPLQGLVLLSERAPSGRVTRQLVDLASAALMDLDAAINGGPGVSPRGRVECRELVRSALERWRDAIPASTVRLRWEAGPAAIEGEPLRVAQALDNVLANAFEHGAPPVLVAGREVDGRLRITVTNAPGRRARSAPAPGGTRPGPRRGHGLALVDEVARAHGGRFAFTSTDRGAVAALELPLAPQALRPAALAAAAPGRA